VTEELVEGPPSRRANAALTACPSGNHLWCIGGEFFSEDGKAVSPFCLWLSKILIVIFSISTTMYLDTPLTKMNGENLSPLLAQVHDPHTP